MDRERRGRNMAATDAVTPEVLQGDVDTVSSTASTGPCSRYTRPPWPPVAADARTAPDVTDKEPRTHRASVGTTLLAHAVESSRRTVSKKQLLELAAHTDARTRVP
jgi:hypothetical protein